MEAAAKQEVANVASQDRALELPAHMEPQATQLTPMQMAYQLMTKGADFAAVKEMLDYGKKLEADAAEKAFNEAMAAAQKDMGVVTTNMANTQTKSRYADYAQLDKALRPIYTKHGFALSFNDGEGAPADWVRIVCHVTNSGHTRVYHKDMPADGKGAKGGDVMTKTHAVGAAQSYAMRYLLRMIFNVAVGEEDEDGNTPKNHGPVISDAQLNELVALAKEAGTTVQELCRVCRVEWLEDLPASQFDLTKKTLLDRIEARKDKPRVDPNTQFDHMERDGK